GGGGWGGDGWSVVYRPAGDGNAPGLFSPRGGSPESRALGPPPAEILSISSRGEMAILLVARAGSFLGTLARVPLAGGAPREILDDVTGADWSPDGASLAVSRRVNGRDRLEFPAGKTL